MYVLWKPVYICEKHMVLKYETWILRKTVRDIWKRTLLLHSKQHFTIENEVPELWVCPVLLYVIYKIGKCCNRENANKDLYIFYLNENSTHIIKHEWNLKKQTYMYITHAHTTNKPSQKAPAAYEVVDSANWDPLNTIVFANYSRINPYLCIEKMKYNIVLTILHTKWHSHL